MGIKTIPAEEYVRQLLGDKDFITSEAIPLDNDFVMSLMIASEYDYRNSNYLLQLLDGRVHSKSEFDNCKL